MAAMDEDLVASLTAVGPQFEATWMKFLFNVPQAMRMKTNATQDQVLAVLLAGQKWNGGGLSTGRASKALYDLSGVGIVKSAIEPYRDCWLYSIALMAGVDFPTVDLPPEVAEAAFNLVAYLEHDEEPRGQPVPAPRPEADSDEESEEPTFDWDEKSNPLPRELQSLWQRAAGHEKKIQMKELLEGFPK